MNNLKRSREKEKEDGPCKRLRATHQAMPLPTLHNNIFLYITDYLEKKEYASVALVCKDWNTNLKENGSYFLIQKLHSMRKGRIYVDIGDLLSWSVPALVIDKELDYIYQMQVLNPKIELKFNQTVVDQLEQAQIILLKTYMKLFKFKLEDYAKIEWFSEYNELIHLYNLIEQYPASTTPEIVALICKYEQYAATATYRGKTIANYVVKCMKCPSKHMNKLFCIIGVKRYGKGVKKLSPEMRDDLDIVLPAIYQHGFAYNYASTRIRFMVAVAKLAIKRKPIVTRHLPPRVRSDRNIKQLLEQLK
jgi:hypothetical protein